jgi:hypothetical protein
MGQTKPRAPFAPDLLAFDKAAMAAVYEKGRWRHQARVLHAFSPEGQTLAHWAASHPQVETLLPPLLTAGARLRELDKNRRTPLARLIQNPACTPELLEWMFVHGAEVGNRIENQSLLRCFLANLRLFRSPLPVARECMDVLVEEARRCDQLGPLVEHAWLDLRVPREGHHLDKETPENDRAIIVRMGLDLIALGASLENAHASAWRDRETFLHRAFQEEMPEWVGPLIQAGAPVQPHLNTLALDLLDWSYWGDEEEDGPWPPVRRARFEALHEALFGMLANGADPLLPTVSRWEPKGLGFWDFLDAMGDVGVTWRTGFQARLDAMALTGALPEAVPACVDKASSPPRTRRL